MATRATIFNIQKFSVNDGPGIRTTIFLKGCPLRCPWCSNPESQLRAPQLEWSSASCNACGMCLALAPDAGSTSFGGKRHLDIANINAASSTAERVVAECPRNALAVSGKELCVNEVLKVCLQDVPFYDESGGGVTFSGGEALLWPQFVQELADALHGEGVSTCIETTGFAAPEVFWSVVRHMDYVLIDLKHWDDARHQAVVGVPLSPILANAKTAVRAGKDVLVRIPVIPGFDFTPDASDGFAARLTEVGATKVQLLPYHNFGQNKYALIGRAYGLSDAAALHPEDLTGLVDGLRAHGFDAFV